MIENKSIEISIDSTAIVSSKAILSEGVKIGPYCIIGDNVILGKNVELVSHIYIDGFTEIGNNTKIFPFTAIGCIPQDLKYKGEESRIKIGMNNTIRENVTIHGGTKMGRMETTIGNNCLFMVATHIAHDCVVGDNIIMSNNATLGGHVIVEDNVIIGGLSAVHQFVRIGKHVIIGGITGVVGDIVPYASVAGDRAKILGVNTRGLRRYGIKNDDISDLHKAFDLIFKKSDEGFENRIEKVALQYEKSVRVMEVVNFLRGNKVRPICTSFK
jgi:UDP-N-acetylglucosamine acyltransferase